MRTEKTQKYNKQLLLKLANELPQREFMLIRKDCVLVICLSRQDKVKWKRILKEYCSGDIISNHIDMMIGDQYKDVWSIMGKLSPFEYLKDALKLKVER